MHVSLCQLCLTLCDPMVCSPTGSSVMGLSRQEHWSGWTFPSLGDLLDPGIEPTSLRSQALAGGLFTASTTWEAHVFTTPWGLLPWRWRSWPLSGIPWLTLQLWRGGDLGLWATLLSWGPDCYQRAGSCSQMPGGVACDAAGKPVHVWVQF